MTINNIQRDSHYLQVSSINRIAWSTPSNGVSNTITVNHSNSVNYDYGHVQAEHGANLTLGFETGVSVGLLMQQPRGDRGPYRIKANASLTVAKDHIFCISISVAPASTTGTDDVCENPILLPFNGTFDELITIEQNDTLPDRPIVIAVTCIAGEAIAENVIAHLSVQNLGVRPPTMQNAVS